MRDWWTGIRLVWSVRRANRRYLRRYVRYGPGLGATPEEICAIYRQVGDQLTKAIIGR